MLKFAIAGVASLAFVGTAVAADLPRKQPVAAERANWQIPRRQISRRQDPSG